MLDRKVEARARIDRVHPKLVALSHRIHASPELGFEEVRASGWLAEALEAAGLEVERGVGELRTAFTARVGEGPLHLAVCAEYDALPELGHACGHNVIAATAVGVAAGLAPLANDLGITLRIIGTPSEELGNGKALLLERGVFDGVHAAMMVHPAPVDVLAPPLLAFSHFDVCYRGREAHASAFPELGVNALDAMTLAQTAIGLLRQHLRPTDRVHGILTRGGEAPNVIPAYSEASYMVRARSLDDLAGVEGRVRRCFEAGALATGARLEIVQRHASYAEMRHHEELTAIYGRNASALGRSFPDLGDLLARGAGSTDMGNVSQAIPSIHPAIGIDCFPVANHQPEFAEHSVSPAADRAILDGASALVWTIIDVAEDEALRVRLSSAPPA